MVPGSPSKIWAMAKADTTHLAGVGCNVRVDRGQHPRLSNGVVGPPTRGIERRGRSATPDEAARESMSTKGTKRIGQLIRSARMVQGLTQKDLARKLGVRSGSYVGMLESGLCKGIGVSRLEEIASFLEVGGVDLYRWMAAAGHLPPNLFGALMKRPERWDDIMSTLGANAGSRGPRSSRRPRARN